MSFDTATGTAPDDTTTACATSVTRSVKSVTSQSRLRLTSLTSCTIRSPPGVAGARPVVTLTERQATHGCIRIYQEKSGGGQDADAAPGGQPPRGSADVRPGGGGDVRVVAAGGDGDVAAVGAAAVTGIEGDRLGLTGPRDDHLHPGMRAPPGA